MRFSTALSIISLCGSALASPSNHISYGEPLVLAGMDSGDYIPAVFKPAPEPVMVHEAPAAPPMVHEALPTPPAPPVHEVPAPPMVHEAPAAPPPAHEAVPAPPVHEAPAAPPVHPAPAPPMVHETAPPAAPPVHKTIEAPPPPMAHPTAPAEILPPTPPTHPAAAATHTVIAGGDSLIYDPPSIAAAIGDIIHIIFLAKNHTLTQSTFAEPCIKHHTSFTMFPLCAVPPGRI